MIYAVQQVFQRAIMSHGFLALPFPLERNFIRSTLHSHSSGLMAFVKEDNVPV